MTDSFRDWLRHLIPHAGETIPFGPDGMSIYVGQEFVVLEGVPGAWDTPEELHTELHRNAATAETCIFLTMVADAWLGAIEQWKYDCADCGIDSTDERYMVHDHVWTAAGMCPFGFLCVGCIEKRLERLLNSSDFLDVPLNHAPGYRRSERLAARLASRT